MKIFPRYFQESTDSITLRDSSAHRLQDDVHIPRSHTHPFGYPRRVIASLMKKIDHHPPGIGRLLESPFAKDLTRSQVHSIRNCVDYEFKVSVHGIRFLAQFTDCAKRKEDGLPSSSIRLIKITLLTLPVVQSDSP